MAAPLILARTFQDAHAFAQNELGLSIGYYRVVNSAGTIKACRSVDIFLVPGWDKRPDRFTMKSALKWCRLTVRDVATERESAAAFDAAMPPTPEVEDTRYANDERTQEVARRYNALLSVLDPSKEGPHGNATTVSLEEALAMQDPALAEMPEPAEAIEAAEPPKKRRRRKCKKCEQMHYAGDPCIESE